MHKCLHLWNFFQRLCSCLLRLCIVSRAVLRKFRLAIEKLSFLFVSDRPQTTALYVNIAVYSLRRRRRLDGKIESRMIGQDFRALCFTFRGMYYCLDLGHSAAASFQGPEIVVASSASTKPVFHRLVWREPGLFSKRKARAASLEAAI
jgi:hypothetical protein